MLKVYANNTEEFHSQLNIQFLMGPLPSKFTKEYIVENTTYKELICKERVEVTQINPETKQEETIQKDEMFLLVWTTAINLAPKYNQRLFQIYELPDAALNEFANQDHRKYLAALSEHDILFPSTYSSPPFSSGKNTR